MPGSRRWLTTTQAAAILGVSGKSVARWVKEGKLAHTKTLGGHARFDEAEVRKLRDELTYRPAQVGVLHG